MIKADITFYKEVFNGTSVTDERIFNKHLRVALTYLNTFTFSRLNRLNEDEEDVELVLSVKQCQCEIVEYLVDVDGDNIKSESVDGWSRTYENINKLKVSTVIEDIVDRYLGDTGLMCSW